MLSPHEGAPEDEGHREHHEAREQDGQAAAVIRAIQLGTVDIGRDKFWSAKVEME